MTVLYLLVVICGMKERPHIALIVVRKWMEKGKMRMPDKYDFACMVDDIFKECKTMSDVNFRFIEMQNALTHLFNQK